MKLKAKALKTPLRTVYSTGRTMIVNYLIKPKGRIIAIGDVHGCIFELNELILKLDPTTDDTIVFLGDLVDRGPSSGAVIYYIRALSAKYSVHCVMGNHDERHARYRTHLDRKLSDPSYKIHMNINQAFKETHEDIGVANADWLTKLPHAIVFRPRCDGDEQVVCVHAGMLPSRFNQDPKAFIRNRFVIRHATTGKLVPAQSIEKDGQWYVPEGSVEWYQYWPGDWKVIFGHSVRDYPTVVNNCYGIDTGCCFGKRLTAMIIEDGKEAVFMDVPAQKVYVER